MVTGNNSQLLTLALLFAASSTEAFVPVPRSNVAAAPSIVQPSCTTPSFLGNGHPSPNMRGGTSLTMMTGSGNMVDRFFRVMRSNINKFVASMEDPEKVIVQAVDDMQNDLIKVRQAYAEGMAGQRRLRSQKDQLDAVASDWYNRAQLALQRNNEGLAREALARRQIELDKANALQLQIDTQSVAIDKLYNAMNVLEEKIREAASKKQQLVARTRTAKTTTSINNMLSGLTGKSGLDAFNRMQEKVEALEAAAEASAELSMLPTGSDFKLESDFRMLEQSSAVDIELEKMKEKIGERRMLQASTEKKLMDDRIKIPVGQGEALSYIRIEPRNS